MQAVDAMVLDAIERQVFDAAAVDACLDEAVKLWEAERTPAAAARAAVKDELRRVESEIAALEHQLVSGAPWTLIAEPMATRKQRRDTLRADVANADTRDHVASQLSGPALRAEFAARLADWRGLGARQPEEARGLLMRLLDGQRIVFRPLGKGKTCEISGEANYAPILESGGIRVWPQRDSNPCFSLERAMS